MDEQISRRRVTITLGRSGGVVSRHQGSMSDADFSISSQGAGTKRSIRDRLGTNSTNTKRHRAENQNALGINKNDLRFKLMQKKNDENLKTGDLREKLAAKERHRQRFSERRQLPPKSVDTRQHMPPPNDPRLWLDPSRRNRDDLPRMESPTKLYSPWTLDHLRHRSPDKPMSNPRGVSPPRREELIQRRPSNGAYDDMRSIPYMRKDVIDSHRPVGPSYMAKPAGPGKPMQIPSMGPPPQMIRPPPGPMPTTIVQKSSYVSVPMQQMLPDFIGVVFRGFDWPEEPQTIDSLLHSLGLGKYAILFKAEEIDMGDLKQMGESDLKELGIPMGPRKKILQAVLPRSKRHV
ncbi:hypothetical protein ACFE04_024847 [Oxalis oulophora]